MRWRPGLRGRAHTRVHLVRRWPVSTPHAAARESGADPSADESVSAAGLESAQAVRRGEDAKSATTAERVEKGPLRTPTFLRSHAFAARGGRLAGRRGGEPAAAALAVPAELAYEPSCTEYRSGDRRACCLC